MASGALDRLHQEADACVRYDPERKLWIYLHAQRTPTAFQSVRPYLPWLVGQQVVLVASHAA